MGEITNSLLVAIMFITVLSIGVGALLPSLASIFDQRSEVRFHWVVTGESGSTVTLRLRNDPIGGDVKEVTL